MVRNLEVTGAGFPCRFLTEASHWIPRCGCVGGTLDLFVKIFLGI